MAAITKGRLIDHPARMNRVVFSPDGAYFVAGDWSGGLTVRSRAGDVLATTVVSAPGQYLKPTVLGVAWSPDGAHIATMESHVVRLRRADDLTVLAELPDSGIGPIAFGGNGTWLAIADARVLRLRAVPSLDEIATVAIERRRLDQFWVHAGTADPAGTLFVTADDGGRTEDETEHVIDRDSPQVTLFDATTGAVVAEVEVGSHSHDVQFDRWRRLLYVVGHKGTNVCSERGEVLRQWQPYQYPVKHLAISERHLATMPDMGFPGPRTIDLWDPESFAHLASISLDGARPEWIVSSPDGAMLVTPTKDALQTWDVEVPS